MSEFSVVLNFFVALAIGALIGIEREYAQNKRGFKAFAGIRTFTLLSLFGALAAFAAQTFGIAIYIIAFLSISTLILLGYFHRKDKIGATTEVASFIVFLLGGLAMYGFSQIALAIAIIITFLLYARFQLHKFTKSVNSEELYSTLKFAIIAFVILPFLPNKSYGPFGGFNPYVIWLMVVFVTGLSLVGYILVKWLGQKGLKYTGIIGGLISSTAVSQTMAGFSKKVKNYNPLVLGVVASNTIMFIRVMIEIFVVNRAFFFEILLPLSFLTFSGITVSLLLWFHHKETKPVKFTSPFRLGPALEFGILFGAVLFFSKLAASFSSDIGIYATSLISGLVDMDAITLSMAQLAGDQITTTLAAQAIFIAALTNTMVKVGIGYLFGTKKFAMQLLLYMGIIFLIGLALLIFII